LGSAVTVEEIAAIDIDVMPDGRGAPPGSGDYETGKGV
jgi:cytochrome c